MFAREFDENLQRRLSEYFHEDEALDLPSAPDVCNYLMSEVSKKGIQLKRVIFGTGKKKCVYSYT